MSSTLSQLLDENTMSPPSATSATSVTSSVASTPEQSHWTSIPVWIMVVLIVAVALYFLPFLLDYLSLPEQIVEEEVKKEVNRSKKKKLTKDFIEARASEEVVDKAGVLEERGYCYIGTDRGIRSCIDVSPGDKCMSGQIFPRRDICVNPSLRL